MNTSTLYISPFFFPERISTGKWNTIVCRELVSKTELTVFCMHPFYPKWCVVESELGIDNIQLIRSGEKLKFPKNKIFRRVFLELFFFFALRKFLRCNKKYDNIIYVLPPSLGLLLVPLYKPKNLVCIVHDLQSVHALSGNNSLKRRLLAALINSIEGKAFRICDKLIFLSKEMQQEVVSANGIDSRKTEVVYPFLTISSFSHGNKIRDLLPPIGYINVVYSGALGEKQNPDGLLSLFIAVSNANEKIRCSVFSEGDEYERLKKFYGSSKVNFQPLVLESDLPELLERSDIQIIPQMSGTSRGSLPSKLPNILASRSRVFIITDKGSELESIGKQFDGVLVSNTWREQSNVDDLIWLCSQNNELSSRMDKVVSKFSLRSAVDKILM